MATRKKTATPAQSKKNSILLEIDDELHQKMMSSRELLEGTLRGASELDRGLGVRWEDVLRERKSR
jgi:hypothetical protein